MNELASNIQHKNSESQELGDIPPQKVTESWQEYYTRISQPGYQSSCISPDDSPFSPQESLQVFLNDVEEASPAEPVGVLIVKSLNALIDIAKSLNTQPDYSDQLNEIIDLWRETNQLLRAKGKPHQSSEEV